MNVFDVTEEKQRKTEKNRVKQRKTEEFCFEIKRFEL
jgi:hypothetical protein